MKRIDTATKAIDLFGAGKHGFKDGNLGLGVAPTDLNASFFNSVQEELCSLIEAAGIALNPAASTQLASAIDVMVRRRAGAVCIAGGTANAITGAFAPAVTAYANGMRLMVRAIAANTTTTPTFAPDGLVAKTIVKGINEPLAANDIAGSGHLLDLHYDQSLDKWVLLNPAGSRLINVRAFTAGGVYAETLGTTSIIVELVAAGGAGGGAAATGVAQNAAAGGGGAGGYASSRLTSGFSGATMTVGAGGVGVAGGNGGTGGSTSFGALLSAVGGTGGPLAPATATSSPTAWGGGNGGSGLGGNLVNAVGGTANPGFMGANAISGAGGASRFGAGAPYVSPPADGLAGISPGSGGAGAALLASAAARPGGRGADGLILVWEYA